MKTNKKKKSKPREAKLKSFGESSMAYRYGYDLGIIIGWFEDMVQCEEDGDYDPDSPKGKRVKLAYDALQNMQEIYDMEPQDE